MQRRVRGAASTSASAPSRTSATSPGSGRRWRSSSNRVRTGACTSSTRRCSSSPPTAPSSSRACSRARARRVSAPATSEELFARFAQQPADFQLRDDTLQLVRARLMEQHELALTAEDLRGDRGRADRVLSGRPRYALRPSARQRATWAVLPHADDVNHGRGRRSQLPVERRQLRVRETAPVAQPDCAASRRLRRDGRAPADGRLHPPASRSGQAPSTARTSRST